MSRLEDLQNYPYRRLDALVGDTTSDKDPIFLHIGEPKFGAPKFLEQAVNERPDLWAKYPPTTGLPELRQAIADWVTKRFNLTNGLIDADTSVHPLAGSKDGLFQSAIIAVMRKESQLSPSQRPIVISPNPLYHPYFGAALGNNVEFLSYPLTEENGFLPDINHFTEDQLSRVAMFYVCTPSNPTGSVIGADLMRGLIAKAREHDFMLASDECYSEVYFDEAPVSALECCGDNTSNVIVLNSLSKRSGAPGLRGGFLAGDPQFVSNFSLLRGYVGGAIPGPLQVAQAALWRDEAHADHIRGKYQSLFKIAHEQLKTHPGYTAPQGGFFVWLNVGDGTAFARDLWRHQALKLLPGEIMSRPLLQGSDQTPGDAFVRLALIYDEALTEEALARLAAML